MHLSASPVVAACGDQVGGGLGVIRFVQGVLESNL